MQTRGRSQAGFTLLELVIGILVSAIAITLLTSTLYPQADKAGETLQRMRSAELAHSILNEIWGKRFDENSGVNGGVPACGSADGVPCADDPTGPSSKNRNDFDNVSDYHGLTINSLMLNSSQRYVDRYPNFLMSVSVGYRDSSTKAQKLITVTVTTPDGEDIVYQAIRSNY
ncbi:prepilin-type N-terminal cleavage/methylation domain-containing protein [Paraferrimonas haliotis]|uniref:MSHA biogenesis protein MshD n=1 Tax=Paraferrimonas haliotis TaxID=2013866 RepID=A0AA37TMT6_9GAMM|nr:prepilin-type N-terminal cleavage/methylation domain-containing protein [Paraferrimonas haliotis]GLS82350.1 MSHA biogenesis protein MshD [Paraferrimonas haliotis]